MSSYLGLGSHYGASINGSPSPRANSQKRATSTLTGRSKRKIIGSGSVDGGAMDVSYVPGAGGQTITDSWVKENDYTRDENMSRFTVYGSGANGGGGGAGDFGAASRRRRSPSPAFSVTRMSHGPLFTTRISRRRLLPEDSQSTESSPSPELTQVPNTVDIGTLEEFSELSVVQKYKNDPKHSLSKTSLRTPTGNSTVRSKIGKSIFSQHQTSATTTQQQQVPPSPTAEIPYSPGYEQKLVDEAARQNAEFKFSTFQPGGGTGGVEDTTFDDGMDLPSFHFSSPVASSTPRATSKINGRIAGRNSLFLDGDTVLPYNGNRQDQEGGEEDITVLPADPPSIPDNIGDRATERPESALSSASSHQSSTGRRVRARRHRKSMEPIKEVSGGSSYLRDKEGEKTVIGKDLSQATIQQPTTVMRGTRNAIGGQGSDEERRSRIKSTLGSSIRRRSESRGRLDSIISRKYDGVGGVGGSDTTTSRTGKTVLTPATSTNVARGHQIAQEEATETFDWLRASNFATPQMRTKGGGIFGHRTPDMGGVGQPQKQLEEDFDETGAGDETILPSNNRNQTQSSSTERAERRIDSPTNRTTLFSTTLRDLPVPSFESSPNKNLNIQSPPRQDQGRALQSLPPSSPPLLAKAHQTAEEESTADVTKEMHIEGTPVVVVKRSKKNRSPSISPEELAANETVVRDALTALSRVSSPALSDHNGVGSKEKGKQKASDPRPEITKTATTTFASRYGVAEKLSGVSSTRHWASWLGGKERAHEQQQQQQQPQPQSSKHVDQQQGQQAPLERPQDRGEQLDNTSKERPKSGTTFSTKSATPQSHRVRLFYSNNANNTMPSSPKPNEPEAQQWSTSSTTFSSTGPSSSSSFQTAMPSTSISSQQQQPTPPQRPRPGTPQSRKNKAHLYEKNLLESPTNSDYDDLVSDNDKNFTKSPLIPSQTQKRHPPPLSSFTSTATTANASLSKPPLKEPNEKAGLGNTKTSLKKPPTMKSGFHNASSDDDTTDSIAKLVANDAEYESLLSNVPLPSKARLVLGSNPTPGPSNTQNSSSLSNIANSITNNNGNDSSPSYSSATNTLSESEYEVAPNPHPSPRRGSPQEEDPLIESNPRFIVRLKEAEMALLGKMNNKLQTLQIELRSTKKGIELLEKKLESEDDEHTTAVDPADVTLTGLTEPEKQELRKAMGKGQVGTARRILSAKSRIKSLGGYGKGQGRNREGWDIGKRCLLYTVGAMAVLVAVLILELVLLNITARVPCRSATEFTDGLCSLRSLPPEGGPHLPVDGLTYLPLGSPVLGLIANGIRWVVRALRFGWLGEKIQGLRWVGRLGWVTESMGSLLRRLGISTWEVVKGWLGVGWSVIYGAWRLIAMMFGLVGSMGSWLARGLLSSVHGNGTAISSPSVSRSLNIPGSSASTSPFRSDSHVFDVGEDELVSTITYNAGKVSIPTATEDLDWLDAAVEGQEKDSEEESGEVVEMQWDAQRGRLVAGEEGVSEAAGRKEGEGLEGGDEARGWRRVVGKGYVYETREVVNDEDYL